MINRKIIFYFISILLHLVLLLFMGLIFNFSHELPKLGHPQAINSYVYKESKISSLLNPKKIISKTLKTTSQTKKELVLNKQQSAHKNISKPVSPASAYARGVSTKELLALLHAAIQNQQHYPESAMEMERQGRVTIKFILMLDGNVKNVQILKSSGTQSLDVAAVAAVNDAAPFNTKTYLKKAREFTVDVVFELA